MRKDDKPVDDRRSRTVARHAVAVCPCGQPLDLPGRAHCPRCGRATRHG